MLLAAGAALWPRRRETAARPLPSYNAAWSLRARLEAVARLESRGGEAAWQRLEAESRHPDPLLSLAAACALCRMEPRRALEFLGPDLQRRADWPLARLGSLFEQLGAAVVTPALTQWLIARQELGLVRLVKLARFGQRHRVASIVRGWLTGNDPAEVVMAALEFVETEADVAWVRSAAQHDDWRVRMAAARALARVGRHGEVAVLTGLLQDPVWWVRYHAAHALTRVDGISETDLELLRQTVRDAFAADMLGQALAAMRWR